MNIPLLEVKKATIPSRKGNMMSCKKREKRGEMRKQKRERREERGWWEEGMEGYQVLQASFVVVLQALLL